MHKILMHYFGVGVIFNQLAWQGSAQNRPAQFIDDGKGNFIIRNTQSYSVLIALQNFWNHFTGGQNEGIRAGQAFFQQSKRSRGQLFGINAQVAKISANKRQLGFFWVYMLNPAYLFYSPLLENIAAQPVDRIGRVDDDASPLEAFNGFGYLAGLRIPGMNL